MSKVEFFGKCFEYGKKKVDFEGFIHPIGRKYYTINEAYGNPSSTKCYIWEDWRERFFADVFDMRKGIKDASIWISSKNCNFFTINAYIVYNDNTGKAFVITKAHNRVFDLENVNE